MSDITAEEFGMIDAFCLETGGIIIRGGFDKHETGAMDPTWSYRNPGTPNSNHGTSTRRGSLESFLESLRNNSVLLHPVRSLLQEARIA